MNDRALELAQALAGSGIDPSVRIACRNLVRQWEFEDSKLKELTPEEEFDLHF